MLGRICRATTSVIQVLGRATFPNSILTRSLTLSSSPNWFSQLINIGGSKTASITRPLLSASNVCATQTCTYKCPSAIHRRCKHCYIVKRQGRLFVECKVHPRHKQMQRMSKRKLFKED